MQNYVAVKPLTFGEDRLKPGDPVPIIEGRDYTRLLKLGLIAVASASSHDGPMYLRFAEGDYLFFVGEDGDVTDVVFEGAEDADDAVRESLGLPAGAAVALVTFPGDSQPTYVSLGSLLPQDPTQRLLDAQKQPATPWQEGSLVVWVNADGAPQLMTFEGLDNPGDVQLARVRPLTEEGQPEAGVQQVRLEDLLPGAPATLLMAFEQNRVAEAAATHAQASEVQLALADKLEGRITFLELLIKAVRTPGDELPGDFPAAEQLTQNGVTTLPGLRLLADGEHGRANLMALDAIGASRADKILAALAAISAEDADAMIAAMTKPSTPEG